jgi:hypothetical protein
MGRGGIWVLPSTYEREGERVYQEDGGYTVVKKGPRRDDSKDEEVARENQRTLGMVFLVLGITCLIIYFGGMFLWPVLAMACFIPIMGIMFILGAVAYIWGKDGSYTFPWARDDRNSKPVERPYGQYPTRQHGQAQQGQPHHPDRRYEHRR